MDQHIIKKRLNEHGVKATPQRMVIYEALMSSEEHPSAEKIYDRIKEQHPSISLGTVYKTMDTLVEAGLAKKVKTADDILRFDGKLHGHGHLHCTRTNKIMDYEDAELQKLLEDYFQKKRLKNFKIHEFQVQINGEIVDNNSSINKLKP